MSDLTVSKWNEVWEEWEDTHKASRSDVLEWLGIEGREIWWCEWASEGGDSECFDERDRDERIADHGQHRECGPRLLLGLEGVGDE